MSKFIKLYTLNMSSLMFSIIASEVTALQEPMDISAKAKGTSWIFYSA
jgi:hypothetical protein